jgi:hypothetical protein
MGMLFNPSKAPDPPPPPPNPQQAAKADTSLTGGPAGLKDSAGGTLLTSPSGTSEVKTGGKTLMGQ